MLKASNLSRACSPYGATTYKLNIMELGHALPALVFSYSLLLNVYDFSAAEKNLSWSIRDEGGSMRGHLLLFQYSLGRGVLGGGYISIISVERIWPVTTLRGDKKTFSQRHSNIKIIQRVKKNILNLNEMKKHKKAEEIEEYIKIEQGN